LIPTGFLAGLIIANIHYIAPFIFSAIGLGIELLFLVKFFHDQVVSIQKNDKKYNF